MSVADLDVALGAILAGIAGAVACAFSLRKIDPASVPGPKAVWVCATGIGLARWLFFKHTT